MQRSNYASPKVSKEKIPPDFSQAQSQYRAFQKEAMEEEIARSKTDRPAQTGDVPNYLEVPGLLRYKCGRLYCGQLHPEFSVRSGHNCGRYTSTGIQYCNEPLCTLCSARMQGKYPNT